MSHCNFHPRSFKLMTYQILQILEFQHRAYSCRLSAHNIICKNWHKIHLICVWPCIINVGFTLSQATKALWESRGIALLYFRPLYEKGVRGQRHAPAAPYPRERPVNHCTGGWVGLRAGLDWCGKSRPTGIWSPVRPARRQSLYRLSYRAHRIINVHKVI